MKLTWFGGTTIRIHIGGAILVIDPQGAPAGIATAELVSGADSIIEGFGVDLEEVDLVTWKPRKVPRLLDEGDSLPLVQAWSADRGAILIEAVGEPPLLLVSLDIPTVGRWTEHAVVVVFGDANELRARGGHVVGQFGARLLALAGNEAAVDEAIPALRDSLDETGLVALEAGLALEV